jgi:hypothetical protein
MSSGQDVSEFLDILGLVKAYFSSFFEKKIKKNRDFFLWCSGRPRGSDDLPVCRIAC